MIRRGSEWDGDLEGGQRKFSEIKSAWDQMGYKGHKQSTIAHDLKYWYRRKAPRRLAQIALHYAVPAAAAAVQSILGKRSRNSLSAADPRKSLHMRSQLTRRVLGPTHPYKKYRRSTVRSFTKYSYGRRMAKLRRRFKKRRGRRSKRYRGLSKRRYRRSGGYKRKTFNYGKYSGGHDVRIVSTNSITSSDNQSATAFLASWINQTQLGTLMAHVEDENRDNAGNFFGLPITPSLSVCLMARKTSLRFVSTIAQPVYLQVDAWQPRMDVPAADIIATNLNTYITTVFDQYYGTGSNGQTRINTRLSRMPGWISKFRRMKSWRIKLMPTMEKWISYVDYPSHKYNLEVLRDSDWRYWRKLSTIFTWRVEGPMVHDTLLETVHGVSGATVNAIIYHSVHWKSCVNAIDKGFNTQTLGNFTLAEAVMNVDLDEKNPDVHE